MTETIIAAAIRIPVGEELRGEMWNNARVYPDDLIVSSPPPARHSTIIHPLAIYGINVGPEDQGFLTSSGRYVGREDALKIVLAAGQTLLSTGTVIAHNSQRLYSEDLW